MATAGALTRIMLKAYLLLCISPFAVVDVFSLPTLSTTSIRVVNRPVAAGHGLVTLLVQYPHPQLYYTVYTDLMLVLAPDPI